MGNVSVNKWFIEATKFLCEQVAQNTKIIKKIILVFKTSWLSMCQGVKGLS